VKKTQKLGIIFQSALTNSPQYGTLYQEMEKELEQEHKKKIKREKT